MGAVPSIIICSISTSSCGQLTDPLMKTLLFYSKSNLAGRSDNILALMWPINVCQVNGIFCVQV